MTDQFTDGEPDIIHDPSAHAQDPDFKAKIAKGEMVPVQAEKAVIQAREAGQRFNPLDLPPEVFKAGLERRGANRATLMEWIGKSLVAGVDYGRIHVVKKDKCPKGRYCEDEKHFSKNSLWKPGAEKIIGKLGYTPTWPALKAYEEVTVQGKPINAIILRCYIIDSNGAIVGEGMGARSVVAESGDLNKAIKMAKKSSLVDATLTTGGLSEIFTQDIEDMKLGDQGTSPQQEPPQGPPPPKQNEIPARVELENKLRNLIRDEMVATKTPLPVILERITAYTDRNGNPVAGEKSMSKLSDARLKVTYGKYKKEREGK